MTEMGEDMREGLLALAVGTGLQVIAAIMDEDVSAVCGPKGRHDSARSAVRHGTEAGSVTLGGRRVPVTGRGCAAPTVLARCRCPRTSCSLHRDPRLDGDGSDAVRAVDAPLRRTVWRRSGNASNERPPRRASRQSAAGSSRRPRPRWPSCWRADLSTGPGGVDDRQVCTSVITCAWSALGIGIDGTKHPLAWSKAAPRTPRPSPSCSSGCASGAWTPAGRSSSASTERRHCAPLSCGSSMTR